MTYGLIGAYASLPADQAEQEEYYRLLAQIPGVRGLEIPYVHGLGDLPWLAAQLAPHWDRNIVTGVGGTMVRVWDTGTFGLASTSAEGRTAALAFTRELRDAVEALREACGRDVVAGVEIHSAPSGEHGVAHCPEAFGESLAEIVDYDWGGAPLLVEHCDAFVAPDRGEKRLMSLDDELAVLAELGRPEIRMTLNWGRSALEARDAAVAAQHVRQVRAAGLLEGVMFSGAGPADTQYAKAWMDGHLPLDVDEPGSAMGAAQVRECTVAALATEAAVLSAAGSPAALAQAAPAAYIGAKCQVPDVDLATRLRFVRNILDATEVAQFAAL
ncbi:Uncharacterised protein [Actinomyces bovis]|uniref:DUF4862 domain-containing protein n=1 Tax=Actinomyces bovis TaxID=1658 RepID=A0ABY1VLK8_9ACTO|nr:DUF4862 family protein [Actinomyces bovis]SPT52976.1 Uncharacterised protein [Actinomyces bovis]VEG55192.1 Uncharacterised protein [Actinomyces israelii]